jgi:hypothetical protein
MKIAFCDNFYILFSTQPSLTESLYVPHIMHVNLTLWESELIIHPNLTLRKSVYLTIHVNFTLWKFVLIIHVNLTLLSLYILLSMQSCTSQPHSVYNPFSRAMWSWLCNKFVLHFLKLSIFMYQVPANRYGNTTFTCGRFTDNVVLQCHFADRNHRLRSYFWGGTYLYSLFRAEGFVLSPCWE